MDVGRELRYAFVEESESLPKGTLLLLYKDAPMGAGLKVRWCTDEENLAFAATAGKMYPLDEGPAEGYFARMNSPEVNDEKLQTAYAALEEAEETLFLAEENRIEAAIARETAYLAAISEAIADGITDPGRQQQKAQRATREQLTTLHQAEKASRAAQHGYKLAGIRLDSLNRRIQLLQLLQERSK